MTRTGSTESRVAWTIQASDDGRRLSCTATNPRNSAYAVMNYTTLTVIRECCFLLLCFLILVQVHNIIAPQTLMMQQEEFLRG